MNKDMQSLIRTYANLIVTSGVSLYPGQCLQIKSGPDTYWFAQEIALAAYESGAQLVRIETEDLRLIGKRAEVQTEKELSYVPDFNRQIDFEMMVKDWAYVRIDNTEDRHWLEHADAAKLSAYKSGMAESGKFYQISRMRNEHPWCVVCAPGPEWAKAVLGPDATVEEFWDVLAPILRLDTPDPIQAWKDHSDMLLKRCKKLDDLHIAKLHFTNSFTDLTIGFTDKHVWMGGGDPLPSGGWFIANIPTEEVFTTPDRLTAEGYVTTTRPVSVMDSLVEGVTLEFAGGKVISCTAKKGQAVMDRFLDTDEGARYLGEVALVDEDSPIAQSNHIFHSILFDENASCHLALGAGYPSCLANAAELNSDEKLLSAGCNRSLVHTDFMVGSADMHIDAITRDGDRVTIMDNGKFVL